MGNLYAAVFPISGGTSLTVMDSGRCFIDADVVRIDSDADMGDITIYSISDKQVLNINAGGSRSLTLQIEVLPAGVYVVKIATNQGEEVRRLIKK